MFNVELHNSFCLSSSHHVGRILTSEANQCSLMRRGFKVGIKSMGLSETPFPLAGTDSGGVIEAILSEQR